MCRKKNQKFRPCWPPVQMVEHQFDQDRRRVFNRRIRPVQYPVLDRTGAIRDAHSVSPRNLVFGLRCADLGLRNCPRNRFEFRVPSAGRGLDGRSRIVTFSMPDDGERRSRKRAPRACVNGGGARRSRFELYAAHKKTRAPGTGSSISFSTKH